MDDIPGTKLLFRDKKGLRYFDGPPSFTPASPISKKPIVDNTLTKDLDIRIGPYFSNDGNLMMIACKDDDSKIQILNVNTGNTIGVIPCKEDAEQMNFSPLGTYVWTWRSPSKSSTPTANLNVWKLNFNESNKEAICEISYHQKKYSSDALQWSSNELLCTRSVTNEIHILNGQALSADILGKIRHEAFTSFTLGSSNSTTSSNNDFQCSVTVFNPEVKGRQARVTVYPIQATTTTTTATTTTSTPLPSSSFSVKVGDASAVKMLTQANEAKVLYAPSGDVLLVHTSTDVDRTGESYYGATGLFILSVDGKISQKVQQSKSGPVYDVQWSPCDEIFVVTAGTMPSQCTLYDGQGNKTFEFGEAHRNTISWAPHGRFLCIAGFGNLAGEMDFYEMTKRKKYGSATSHCAVAYGWSPDSRYFMTATLAPRMNVDNGFKIFKYNGAGPIIEYPSPILATQCCWRPTSTNIYENRPPTPNSRRVTAATATDTLPKPSVYRPPGSTGFLSEMLKRDGGISGKVSNKGNNNKNNTTNSNRANGSGSHARVIPGMSNSATNNNNNNKNTGTMKLSANARKRENKKKAAAAAVTVADTTTTTTTSSNLTPPPPPSSSSVEATSIDPEKKAKAIRKKLKQIDELKLKQNEGIELNDDQQAKLAMEATLNRELKDLDL